MNVYEALDWLKNDCYVESPQDETFDECCDVIEKALLELKAIKEAKPSKALECLHKVASKVELADCDDYWEVRNAYAKVEQALLKAEKLEKAWEIVVKKHVAIFWIKESKSVDDYNYGTGEAMKLTQQEFELLKEVLE